MISYTKLKEYRKKSLFLWISGVTGIIGIISGAESLDFSTWNSGAKLVASLFFILIIINIIMIFGISFINWMKNRR